MLKRILNNKQEKILKDERNWLTDLQVILTKLTAADDDMQTLKNSIQQLDELFLLVIVGEFNAGKSSFINALLGQSMLKEGVTPTTAQVHILSYGDTDGQEVIAPHLHRITAPNEILQQINIVDTPGTNAVIQEHQTITEEFVPRSDLVLFITSADRPFTESERQFMSQIKDWGKKVVITINKIDLFEADADKQQVIDFVRENAQSLLGTAPDIFPVSAREALKGKDGDADSWAKSGFDPLETFIHNTLDESSRVQLKLLNPLGVGDRLLTRYTEINEGRLRILADDFEMLDNLEGQLELYQSDMQRDFKLRMADIENILYEMEVRGNKYFDETMRIARFVDLLNKSKIQGDFEREVVGDTSVEVERKVNDLIDWFVGANLTQWQAVMNYLNERKEEYKEQMVGDLGGTFQYDREHLIDSVGRAAQRVVDTYDRESEAKQIADSAQMAVATSAVTQVGAVGLGALITALATTMAVDVTGIILASGIAVLGMFVIPARRRGAKKEMTEKIADLRTHLVETLTTQFDKELTRSLQRINEAIAPYTRFVRSERTKLDAIKNELNDAQQKQAQLRAEIEHMK
ncbi:MAG: dynamin family protein [Chloroflexota bacterium]